MMPVLIEGPKEPGNDIDVFLQPLMDDLLLLWKEEGVRVWDEYKQESFNLRALLLYASMIGLRLQNFRDSRTWDTWPTPTVMMKPIAFI